jgi:hypothetical protein
MPPKPPTSPRTSPKTPRTRSRRSRPRTPPHRTKLLRRRRPPARTLRACAARTRREAERLRTLRTLGIRASGLIRIRTTDYRVDGVGLPYHLSAVHAAVGRVQLAHFEHVIDRRKNLWRSYARALAALDGVLPAAELPE